MIVHFLCIGRTHHLSAVDMTIVGVQGWPFAPRACQARRPEMVALQLVIPVPPYVAVSEEGREG